MHTEVEPTWISYLEAQRLTSLGRTTLWKICSSGEVKTVRIGRAVRINRRSLEDFLERASEEAAGQSGGPPPTKRAEDPRK